ncbi:hypothetical protein KI387_011547, partial [Taxus chinensis]
MGEITMGKSKKIIIDTDPGVDDAMAIFLAFQSPEVDVIGLTTIYGNVNTTLATKNALHLLEVVGREDIPVAEGSHTSIKRVAKLHVADFVHGSDGLGNTNITPPKGNAIAQSAAEFLIDIANRYPGEVTIVALGPLTNVALAIELEPLFPQKIGQIVILGGAFSMNGNVNPAAEANIFGDPEAADIVFTCGADTIVVGINVTHQVVMTDKDLEVLAGSNGKYAKYILKILKFYLEYHREAYNICGAYLHDPTAMFAAIDPSLMTYVEGVVRVQTEGIFRGLTTLDNMKKRATIMQLPWWFRNFSDSFETACVLRPVVSLAMTTEADNVIHSQDTPRSVHSQHQSYLSAKVGCFAHGDNVGQEMGNCGITLLRKKNHFGGWKCKFLASLAVLLL